MYQYVKTYIENGAGYIILNDPKKLNALSQPMAAEAFRSFRAVPL